MLKRLLLSVVLSFPLSVQPSVAVYNYTQEEISCLAKNIYFEARGEPLVGQLAVGQVTLNRVSSPKYPSSVCEVVYQARYSEKGNPIFKKCQFSWYCDGKPDTIADERAFTAAYSIASTLYSTDVIDVTEGALFYHATSVQPRWAHNMERIARIGDHLFYK